MCVCVTPSHLPSLSFCAAVNFPHAHLANAIAHTMWSPRFVVYIIYILTFVPCAASFYRKPCYSHSAFPWVSSSLARSLTRSPLFFFPVFFFPRARANLGLSRLHYDFPASKRGKRCLRKTSRSLRSLSPTKLLAHAFLSLSLPFSFTRYLRKALRSPQTIVEVPVPGIQTVYISN